MRLPLHLSHMTRHQSKYRAETVCTTTKLIGTWISNYTPNYSMGCNCILMSWLAACRTHVLVCIICDVSHQAILCVLCNKLEWKSHGSIFLITGFLCRECRRRSVRAMCVSDISSVYWKKSEQMAVVLQTTFSMAFSWQTIFVFWFEFHRNCSDNLHFTENAARWWLGAVQQTEPMMASFIDTYIWPCFNYFDNQREPILLTWINFNFGMNKSHAQ